MPKLSEEIQAFIVQAHACFRKPSLIAKDVVAEFGVKLARDQIQFYHPDKGAKGKRLALKWKTLFAATRKEFVESKAQVGIAQQTYRLLLYQRAAEFYEEQGNMVLAAEMAERAAKEVGGAFTNKQEHKFDLTGLSDEDLLLLERITSKLT